MADRLPVKAKYAAGSPVDVIALQEFEPTDTIALNLISGFAAGVTSELANNSISALSDVDVLGSPAPVNGDVLTFNSTSGKWENKPPTGGGGGTWGSITGTLSDQLDLQAALDLKADQTSLDTHTGDATIHFTEASIDHLNILNIGTNSHAVIDTHIGDATVHFTQAAISITESQISDLQSYLLNITTEQISDLSDVSSTMVPTEDQVLAWNNTTSEWEARNRIDNDLAAVWGNITGTLSNQTDLQNELNAKTDVTVFNAHTGDGTIHFTEASIDHVNILNIGTNTHAQIDTHIADTTIHFSTLNGLGDVNAPTPTDGQVLSWNNTASMWEPSTSSGSDELVKVSATDTTAGYLGSELVAGTNITLTVLNPGADEKLEVKYDKGGMPYIATIGGNDMVVYDDTTRASKTLSSESQILYFAETAVANNDWMQIQHATDAASGYIMPFNGTIVSVAMHCENTNGNTKDINLYFDAVSQGSIGQFIGTGEQTVTNTALNIDFVAGDKIRLRGAPAQGIIQDTNIQVRIKWRV